MARRKGKGLHIKANNKNEKYEKIQEKKLANPIEVQCKGLPI
jgi:hypothetical protein